MKAKLIVAASETSADILYASGFLAPDAFVWFAAPDGPRGVVLSQLEFSRGRKECHPGLEVWCSDDFFTADERRRDPTVLLPRLADKLGVSGFIVPGDFPLLLADTLRQGGLTVEVGDIPFFPERQVKNAAEIEKITAGLRAAEAAELRAIAILGEAAIGTNRELYWQGAALTSEIVRAEVGITMLRYGAVASSTIIAGGRQAADPHNVGTGQLYAHQPIVMDIFPRVCATGYWGDITRTVVKGTAPAIVRRAFDAVLAAREAAKQEIKAGVIASKPHETAARILIEHGFENGRDEHGPSGFIHGLGHGVGLDIHERPRLNSSAEHRLQVGEVVTVEPGVYYPSWGGIRLEDMVVVEAGGCRCLNSIGTILEIP